MSICRHFVRGGAVAALFSLSLGAVAAAQPDRPEAAPERLRPDREVPAAIHRTVASPVAPERMRAALEGRTELTPEENFARIVHIAYAQLSRYAANAGHQLDFEIDDLWTLYRRDFDTVLALDLYSLPAGEVIDVVPTRHRSEIDDFAWARYEAKWRQHGDELQAAPEVRRLAGMTLAEVLAERGAADPLYAEVGAATSAEITVRLDGGERTYRALFLWLTEEREPEWKRFEVIIVDNITQAVAQTLVEQLPVEGRRLGLRPPDGGRGRVAGATGTACVANSLRRTIKKQPPAGTNGHITGGHVARADFAFTCACSSSCNSSCTVNLATAACFDTGEPWDACHKMVSAADTSDAFVQNSAGQGVGASCAAGFQCAQKACAFCICNVTVGVTVVGTGISFGSASGADWSRNMQARTDCAPCEFEETTEEPEGGTTTLPPTPETQNPPPDPGDSPGTSYCGSLDCTWDCRASFDAATMTYTEYCSLDCRCIG